MNEQNYHTIIEFAPDAFFQGDEKGNFIIVNEKAIKLTGYSRDELLSMNMSDLFPAEELHEKPLRYDLLNQEHTVISERIIITKKRDKVPVEMNSRAMPDGTYQCFARDITERKTAEQKLIESEEQFKKVFENAADAIFIADVDTSLIVDANNAAENLLLIPRNKIIGMHQASLHPSKDENFSKSTFNQHIQDNLSDSASSPSETKVIRSDGTEVHVEVVANLMFFKGKKCLMGIFRNITRRKETEQKLLEINMQLQETNATKDKLFSIIAHDLKSPFNSILGLSELILENNNVFDKLKCDLYIGQINSSAKHTLTLLDNLLAWAKMQTGQIEFLPLKISFLPLIQEVTEVLYSLAEIKNISLTIEPNCDTLVYADPQMLEIVLRNLISNAIKFTNRGGQIRVSVKNINNHTEISISDNGIGMNETSIKRLFRVDQSFTSTGTDNEKGSGLGLLLCKEFVTRHKGDITVDSIPGKGSRFHFTLPNS